MPKDKKGQLYYQVTHDKPQGLSHVLLIGGSVGTALSFFVVSVLGALNGMDMNDWVFYFLLAAILGFFLGALATWFFVQNFAKVVAASTGLTPSAPEMATAPAAAAAPVDGANPVVPTEEDKGQSVDFVFPELSPDK